MSRNRVSAGQHILKSEITDIYSLLIAIDFKAKETNSNRGLLLIIWHVSRIRGTRNQLSYELESGCPINGSW